MNIDLLKRIALVTGATGQLGRVMARTLASCGADVAIHYHGNRERADDLAAEAVATGVRAIVVQADVTRLESITAMRDTIVANLGEQVTVNQVAPGWTISAQDRERGTGRNPGYEASVPLARRGTDQEVANVVAFLASDLASFITGAFIPVCGGNVMPAI
jgi:NAD(P)-dependent dehydrogenase (short-subunit alcohol dehydrogenase family)